MNLRQALIEQSPSLALQRAADFNGMSLRDYFAARASERDIESWQIGELTEFTQIDRYGRKVQVTGPKRYSREEARYRYADAMLKARQS